MIFILIGIAILTGVCNYVQARIMISISQKTVKKLRDEVFSKIEKLPIKYFDTHPNGELMSRIVNDIVIVNNSLLNSFLCFM